MMAKACYRELTVLFPPVSERNVSPKIGCARQLISIAADTAQKIFERFSLKNQHRNILTARGPAFDAADMKKTS
jgi:hypothetical protein